jgi:hypothetical protein
VLYIRLLHSYFGLFVRLQLGMAIQVRVSSHSQIFDPTGAGAILHLWVHPHPTRTESVVGTGFIFHPWVHPKPEKGHHFGTAAQPSHFALNLSYSHTYISREP